jgi:hypothetical protein
MSAPQEQAVLSSLAKSILRVHQFIISSDSDAVDVQGFRQLSDAQFTRLTTVEYTLTLPSFQVQIGSVRRWDL